jgi:hypothetical protein
MNLVVMQPYLFPYLGYFQLIAAANRFVIYDDVNFIKGGWINRNQILIQGQPHMFTVPLSDPSPNRKICDIQLNVKTNWKSKFLQTISQSYSRAPYFVDAFSLVKRILDRPGIQSITDLVNVSLNEIIAYLALEVELVSSSKIYGNDQLRAQERIIDICQKEQASFYINASGGKELYDGASFEKAGFCLQFLQPELLPYPQIGKQTEFIAGLSIIDVLMNNSPAETYTLLQAYTLSPG